MNEIIITPLGTVSPYPKESMNCPGFLVEYEDYNILLDCGNGITRLLKFPDILKNLHVFITHYHKDHYGDLGAIQYASYVYHNLGLLDNKINIYLPNDTSVNVEVKESYATYEASYYCYHFGSLKVSLQDNHSHSIPSSMIKLENGDFKIVYTSDIGSSNMENVVEFSRDANLLICESSLLSYQQKQMLSRSHLTAYEAGLIAKYAKVEKLLLTHFWPEEDKSLYLEEAKQNFDQVEVAEEGKKLILRR